jgi:hypothetical protein
MKSNILTVSTFLTAAAAIALTPVSAAAAAMAFTAAGLLSVFLSDYGTSIQPFRVSAKIVPFQSSKATHAGMAEAA